MKNSICIIVTLFLLLSQFSSAQPQNRFDLFPLGMNRTYTYSYEYRYSDRELSVLVSSQVDSGTVRYVVIDSVVQADTAIKWTLTQQESLYHYRLDLNFHIDTTYWTNRDTSITLIEGTSGNHALLCSSLAWTFPLLQPQQSVYRYANSPVSNILRWDSTLFNPNFHVDSLAFDTTRGMYLHNAGSHYGVNTSVNSSLHIALVSTSTFVSDHRATNYDRLGFQLSQNYPNPFNPSTTIVYTLASESYVTLQVFDQLGRLVQTLWKAQQSQGTHSLLWIPHGISSGIYFVTLSSGKHTQTRKLILLQ